MGMEEYDKLQKIGSGAMGTAWLVRRRVDGCEVVAKEICVSGLSEKEQEDAMMEVEMLKKLQHPNIISLHHAFLHRGSLYIVMEFADAGDLSQVIKKGKVMSEEKIISIFAQICAGLAHVHSLNILHRDLKTANLLINKTGEVKLADFGIARVMTGESDMAKTMIGTPYYLSPEICEDQPYNHKSDVWALGCVLYELMTLKHAFEAATLPALILKIVRGICPPMPKTFSPELRELVGLMLQRKPSQRPDVSKILSKPIIAACHTPPPQQYQPQQRREGHPQPFRVPSLRVGITPEREGTGKFECLPSPPVRSRNKSQVGDVSPAGADWHAEMAARISAVNSGLNSARQKKAIGPTVRAGVQASVAGDGGWSKDEWAQVLDSDEGGICRVESAGPWIGRGVGTAESRSPQVARISSEGEGGQARKGVRLVESTHESGSAGAGRRPVTRQMSAAAAAAAVTAAHVNGVRGDRQDSDKTDCNGKATTPAAVHPPCGIPAAGRGGLGRPPACGAARFVGKNGVKGRGRGVVATNAVAGVGRVGADRLEKEKEKEKDKEILKEGSRRSFYTKEESKAMQAEHLAKIRSVKSKLSKQTCSFPPPSPRGGRDVALPEARGGLPRRALGGVMFTVDVASEGNAEDFEEEDQSGGSERRQRGGIAFVIESLEEQKDKNAPVLPLPSSWNRTKVGAAREPKTGAGAKFCGPEPPGGPGRGVGEGEEEMPGKARPSLSEIIRQGRDRKRESGLKEPTFEVLAPEGGPPMPSPDDYTQGPADAGNAGDGELANSRRSILDWDNTVAGVGGFGLADIMRGTDFDEGIVAREGIARQGSVGDSDGGGRGQFVGSIDQGPKEVPVSGMQPGADLPSLIEKLRLQCEEKLGMTMFVEAYKRERSQGDADALLTPLAQGSGSSDRPLIHELHLCFLRLRIEFQTQHRTGRQSRPNSILETEKCA